MSSRRLKNNHIIGESQSETPPQGEFESFHLTSTKSPPTMQRQDNTLARSRPKTSIQKKETRIQPQKTSTEWTHYPKTFPSENNVDCSICGDWSFACLSSTGLTEGARCKHWPRFLDELLLLIVSDEKAQSIIQHFYIGFLKRIEGHFSSSFFSSFFSSKKQKKGIPPTPSKKGIPPTPSKKEKKANDRKHPQSVF